MKKTLRIISLLATVLSLSFTRLAFAELACEPLQLAEQKQTIPERHAKGLLWKIHRIGLNPSYLYGTIHLPGKELTTLSVPVKDALDNALSVILEIKIEEDTFARMNKALYYTDDTTLKNKVGQDLYQRTIPLLNKYSFTEAMAAKLKPWAAYLTLSVPPSKGGLPLDMVILKRGKMFGAHIYGLETIEEQLGIFDKLDVHQQTQLLTDTVCNYEILQKDVEEMKALYLKHDLAGLVRVSEKYDSTSEGKYDTLMEELITKRNLRMHERMQDRLMEGNAFFAVGALHLPGENGILGLLEAQGFIVTPIY